MPIRPTPFPLPDAAILTLPPAQLAAAAVSTARRAFALDVDFTLDGLARFDACLAARVAPGRYTAERYPAMLALMSGAFTGAVLQAVVAGGVWGDPPDDIFATPLPFLIFTRGEYARQINVVEDIMAYVWSGKGPAPYAYAREQLAALRKLGFVVSV